MTQAIVYRNADDSIGIIYPTDEGLAAAAPTGGIMSLARKDTPEALPFKVMTIATDIPTDRTFRDAWEFNGLLDDGVGNASNEFD